MDNERKNLTDKELGAKLNKGKACLLYTLTLPTTPYV